MKQNLKFERWMDKGKLKHLSCVIMELLTVQAHAHTQACRCTQIDNCLSKERRKCVEWNTLLIDQCMQLLDYKLSWLESQYARRVRWTGLPGLKNWMHFTINLLYYNYLHCVTENACRSSAACILCLIPVSKQRNSSSLPGMRGQTSTQMPVSGLAQAYSANIPKCTSIPIHLAPSPHQMHSSHISLLTS